ncbi:MAG: DMT family transporter [Pseudonocardiaceae bacterium]
MTARQRRYGIAGAAAFVVMWASGAIAVKFGLRDSDALTFLFLRAAGAMLISWLVWARVRDPLPTTRGEWCRVAAVAVLLQVGYQLAFFLALAQHLPAGLLAVIVGFQPALTALITRSGRSRMLWSGLLLGLVGVTLTVSSSLAMPGPAGHAGVVFGILALLAITLGTIIQGTICTTGTWASLATQTTISTSVMATVTATATTATATTLRLPTSGVFYLALAWMVIVVSVGATALLYIMVTATETVRVTSLFYCVPPVTTAMDYAVFGTRLTAVEIVGMALVVVAIAIIQTDQPRPAPASQAGSSSQAAPHIPAGRLLQVTPLSHQRDGSGFGSGRPDHQDRPAATHGRDGEQE